MKSYAIFGGTFNPIHLGHLNSAKEIVKLLKLDQLVFIPTGISAFKQNQKLIDNNIRYEAIRAAIGKSSKIKVSKMEINRRGVSYTIDTVKHFIKLKRIDFSKGDKLYCILGYDAFKRIEEWKDYKKLSRLVNFVVLTRPQVGLNISKMSQKIRMIAKRLGFNYNKNIGNIFEEKENENKPSNRVQLKARKITKSKTFLPNPKKLGGYPRMLTSFHSKASNQILVVQVTPLKISSSDINQRMERGLNVRHLLDSKVFELLFNNNINGGKR